MGSTILRITMLKIAILGSRGIPNYYGGFEQFAEYLAKALVEKGFKVSVYNSHNHPYQHSIWNGVDIIHCFDPEDKIGTAGQFIYDLNCILDSRKRKFDIILQLGYTSSSVWNKFFPRKKTIITTNMDGLEWKRSKYSKPVRYFLKHAEQWAVKCSHHLIADSIGIQEYLKNKYRKDSVYIPYGANLFENPDEKILYPYGLTPYNYNMLIARLEPENNIETILNGAATGLKKTPFMVIGNHETKYGRILKNKFKSYEHIRFVGAIYDINILNNLRYYSNIYFHGHSVGGTNPSLLEAMACCAFICAHKNPFNSAILQKDALYFSSSEEVTEHIKSVNKNDYTLLLKRNQYKIKSIYSWDNIISQYQAHFEEIVSKAIGMKQLYKANEPHGKSNEHIGIN